MPSVSVRATEAVVYQGPPASSADWPVGAVVSGVTVNVPDDVCPAPFVTVTVFEPLAVSLAPQV